MGKGRENCVDYSGKGTYSAPEVVTAALAIELSSTVVDVRGAVPVHP